MAQGPQAVNDVQTACGGWVVCAGTAVVSFFTHWMPLLQGIAVSVAILSGLLAGAVSLKVLLKK